MTRLPRNIIGLVCVCMAMSACDSEPELSLQKKAGQISRGMNKAQVMDILGAPGNRNFEGTREVRQYCEPALHSEKLVTVYLKEDVVQGLNNSDTGFNDGQCQRYAPVDWDKFKNLTD
jgi:outer membrane protein assembly factor BamE (lipoprotein component of BamABCDE complex)